MHWDSSTGLYFGGRGYYHPRLGRALPSGPVRNLPESVLNSYVQGFPLYDPPPLGQGSAESILKWIGEAPDWQIGLGVAAIATAAAVSILYPPVGIPSVLTGLAIAGAAVGGIHGGLDTYAANPNASLLDYCIGIGLGATFGALAPPVEFVSFGGALLGGAAEMGVGGHFLGTGFQIGGLVGGLGGGFRHAFKAGVKHSSRRAALWAASKSIAPELVGGTIGAGVGFARTGTLKGATHGALLGMFAGGISRVPYGLGRKYLAPGIGRYFARHPRLNPFNYRIKPRGLYSSVPVPNIDYIGPRKGGYRALRPEDTEAIVAGKRIMPKSDRGDILDQIQGRDSKYISFSMTEEGTLKYVGPDGVAVIDLDIAFATGSGLVPHQQVLQVARRQGTTLDVQNVSDSMEALLTNGLDPRAINWITGGN